MPTITPIQKSALDALDSLHFNQVAVRLTNCEQSEEWCFRILNKINWVIREGGIAGKQAEITKHYLLSALEIYLSMDKRYFSYQAQFNDELGPHSGCQEKAKHQKYAEHCLNFSLANLCIVAAKNGVGREFLTRTTDVLINDSELALSSTPLHIRYRLAERCYALEYTNAPLSFYRELVSHGIIPCAKYSHRRDNIAKNSDIGLSPLFIRAGLLFELRMLQRALVIITSIKINGNIVLPNVDTLSSPTERKHVSDYYKRLVDAWFQDGGKHSFAVFKCNNGDPKLAAKRLLKNMSRFYFHKRMFPGSQGSWLGTLGAFDIEAESEENPDTAIYYSENNKNTISKKIKDNFSNAGFNISERSLYLRHKTTRQEGYFKIRYYCSILMNMPCSLPWWSDSNERYDMALTFEDTDDNN